MPHWFKRDVLLMIWYLISAFEQNGTTYWKRYVWSYFLGAFCCFMCWPAVSCTQSLCSEFRRLFKCCWFWFNGTNIGKQLNWFYAAKTSWGTIYFSIYLHDRNNEKYQLQIFFSCQSSSICVRMESGVSERHVPMYLCRCLAYALHQFVKVNFRRFL